MSFGMYPGPTDNLGWLSSPATSPGSGPSGGGSYYKVIDVLLMLGGVFLMLWGLFSKSHRGLKFLLGIVLLILGFASAS